ncbi:MAG: HEPN domain-containing protein [Nitrospirota bacterium]
MKNELIILARYRLSRARETYNDALKLLDEGSLNSAVNRFYYAAFYAARALLATKELDSSKHSGVISLFNRHFVKTGAIEPEKAKVLKKSFEKRQDLDYEDFVKITRSEVEGMKDKILEFIDKCEKLLEELLKK